ncbi:pilin N-terminal domain-containing protein [Lacticaseibacillus sharpeae]|uniref:pilin N-terminal domain-containing protein n=1 Tax=Lacticaseibacillus sharpeae TaxID=1626 RepID=UPI0006D14A6A|nr:pilin N-terminal domain-containing protein [Lacticaseibacillus sharpeae]
MKQNNFLKKALTLVGAAVIAGAVGLGASNHSQADAASAQTEVHLVKYAISGDATPKQADGYAEDADLANKDVVAGAEFSVYDVTDKYWENYDAKLKGKSANEVSTLLNATIPDKDGNPTRNAFFDTPADGETESAFNPDNAFKSGTTDENGKIDFTLDNYNDAGQYKVYLFREESVPAGYAKSADFVLSLPAKGTDDNKSPLTEAWVYPKDQVTGNYQLKFTKVDANNSDVAHNMLSGAIFYITKSETKTVDGEEKTVTKYAQVNGITGQDEAGKDNTLKGFEADQAVVKWLIKIKQQNLNPGITGNSVLLLPLNLLRTGIRTVLAKQANTQSKKKPRQRVTTKMQLLKVTKRTI